jgi:hypothetical protein
MSRRALKNIKRKKVLTFSRLWMKELEMKSKE